MQAVSRAGIRVTFRTGGKRVTFRKGGKRVDSGKGWKSCRWWQRAGEKLEGAKGHEGNHNFLMNDYCDISIFPLFLSRNSSLCLKMNVGQFPFT